MSFIFPAMDAEPEYETLDSYEKAHSRQQLRESVIAIQESIRAAKEQERLLSAQWNRSISFRLPKDQLDRLDAVAADAATTRGQMIRQIIAAYLSYINDCGISYKGSLIK